MDANATIPQSAGERAVKLKLENVSKTYETSTKDVVALAPVNIEIREGEFVVLFGPSGCGKSTVLNLIAGFEFPTSGSITLDGHTIKGPHFERLMMFQEHALFPWLNVIDNVTYGLKRRMRFRRKLRRETARKFLQMVHLEQFERSSIHELSGGMKQRVALARALAPDPKVLLIDEPFPALDALTRAKLYGDIQEIFASTNKTIVHVTHDAREAACLGDRVIVFTGRPGQIKNEFRIDLPRPRDINDPKVAEYAGLITAELENQNGETPEQKA